MLYSSLYYNICQLQNKGIETVQVLNQVDVKSNQAYGLATRRQGTGEETEPVIYEEMNNFMNNNNNNN